MDKCSTHRRLRSINSRIHGHNSNASGPRLFGSSMLTLNTSKNRVHFPLADYMRFADTTVWYFLSVRSRHRVKLKSLHSPGPFHPQSLVPISLSATPMTAWQASLIYSIPENLKFVLSTAGATRLEGLFGYSPQRIINPPE